LKLLGRIVVVVLVVPVLSLPASAQKQFPINFVNEFKQAQDRRQEADKKLIDNMERIADWLVQFRLRFGHFPYVGVEQDNATNYLQKKFMKPNPYTVTGVVSTEESKTLCPLRFVHDIGLIDAYRQDWEKKVPSDWKADPGSITIIINECNNVVIWGAGADHLPILDSKNNKCYFTWRSLN
jgi:hypothetical protein